MNGSIMLREQNFAVQGALVNMAMLLLACMSFTLPTVFVNFSHRNYLEMQQHDGVDVEQLEIELKEINLLISRGIALLALSSYCAYLVFQLYTHIDLFEDDGGDEDEDNCLGDAPDDDELEYDDDLPVRQTSNASDVARRSSRMSRSGTTSMDAKNSLRHRAGVKAKKKEKEPSALSLRCSTGLLFVVTLMVSVSSELLVGAIERVVERSGIGQVFIGTILLPIIGNACEHMSAVRFAIADRTALSIGIAVGSSTQIALLVVPWAVCAGWVMDKPMDLDFHPLNTTVLIISVLIVLSIVWDGRSHWIEGYMLCMAYCIIATLYWNIPDEEMAPMRLTQAKSGHGTGMR